METRRAAAAAAVAHGRAHPGPPEGPLRGYERLYRDHVQQAHLGADFDFLRHESLGEGKP
jgi:hypothetical protein